MNSDGIPLHVAAAAITWHFNNIVLLHDDRGHHVKPMLDRHRASGGRKRQHIRHISSISGCMDLVFNVSYLLATDTKLAFEYQK